LSGKTHSFNLSGSHTSDKNYYYAPLYWFPFPMYRILIIALCFLWTMLSQ